jgi:hypothetical protein
MKKAQLISLMTDLLVPCGFKKEGVNWILDNGSIVKTVDIQKSAFGNNFYINYGYILKSLPLVGIKRHVYLRLGSPIAEEGKKILDLLNFENEITDDQRIEGLKQMLSTHMLANFNAVDNEADILAELLKKPHLNNIPLIVKNHFKIPTGDSTAASGTS